MFVEKTGEVVASRKKQSPWRLVMLSLLCSPKSAGSAEAKPLYEETFSLREESGMLRG
jgi:hypothetical protein